MSRGVSPEQIARAKEISIEEYILANEPDNVKRVGRALYLKDHDSLEISNGLWNWHSQGIGGKNVVDYLMKVRGYGFVDAVRRLAGEDYSDFTERSPPSSKPPPERKPFTLPRRNGDNGRVIEYLQSRGIDHDITLDCIKRGALYQSATWHNCCFVGRDDNGKVKFAALRGTLGDFKCDADGSDKRIGFCLPPENPPSDILYVFESPVDILSFDTLRKLGNIDARDGWRLSLGGTATLALENLIERRKFKSPIAHCVICTDRDKAGDMAFLEIAGKLRIKVSRLIPAGKDWNETLQQIRNEVKPLEDSRKDIRFIDSQYNELFRIKDGECIKFTSYDGEVKGLKCRHIDEAHIRVIGKYSNDYHICEFAERMEQVGNKYEPLPNQAPRLDVIAAKYGEPLQDVSIQMTEAAIRKLTGGRHTTEMVYYGAPEWKHKPYAAILRGKDGIAVLGIGGSNNDKLTSLHPYDAQRKKRELSPATRAEPQAETLLGEIAEARAQVSVRSAADRPAPLKTAEAR